MIYSDKKHLIQFLINTPKLNKVSVWNIKSHKTVSNAFSKSKHQKARDIIKFGVTHYIIYNPNIFF